MKKKIINISATLTAIVTILGFAFIVVKPHIENFIDERIEVKIVSPEIMKKAMNSPFMLDYKMDQKIEWADSELHKDENKLKLSGTLVLKTGMNKDAMADTLASMIKLHCEEKKYVTNDECILNSKKYGRSQIKLTGI
jgi:hypothetical protein